MLLETCITLTEKLIALAVIQQTIELLQLKNVYGDDGIWTPAIAARESDSFAPPLRFFTQAFLPTTRFRTLLLLQLFAAIGVLVLPRLPIATAVAFGIMFLASFVVAARWRGSFNGGADSMTLIVLLCAGLGEVGWENERLWRGVLWYIALQVVLSFAISGFAKVRRASWRQGRSMRDFLRIEKYGAPAWLRGGADSPWLCRSAAWALFAFECSFPLAFVGPRWAQAYVACGVLFNLLNFVVIGLNRFVFAWAAAYPALLFCSQ